LKNISRVGDFVLQWGESLRWDDRRRRLYFVDCAAQRLHWLDGMIPPLHSLPLPSLPTGLVLCENGNVIAALDDALHVVDPDEGTTELLSRYPAAMAGRANDAIADLDGNLVTGTLNTVPTTDGSYWWYSARDGWRQLDDGIGNANGPVVLEIEHERTLVFADTLAFALYAYAYSGTSGTVGERRLFAETRELGGMPDGACADDHGGVWSCVLGAGKIARFTSNGISEAIDTGVELPSDVTFGGDNLDRMFYVSIAVPIAGIEINSSNAGALMVVDDSGYRGRPEPRFHL
jgi:L-arabinonolactonase